jgi:hypothetical protein
VFDPSVPSWRKWSLTVGYAPYLTGSVILILSFGLLLGTFALLKPGMVTSDVAHLSWIKVTLWSLAFSLIVLALGIAAHWLERKRYATV